MIATIHSDRHLGGTAAAKEGSAAIRSAIETHGEISIIIATGASQFETLEVLVKEDIDWSKVTVFHLDEYVGLDETHPASFRKYLCERFVAQVSNLKKFVPVNADSTNLSAEMADLNDLIACEQIAVCFAGIGENCHLAFNDPPADFNVNDPYIIVDLDAACRAQQLGEGWFETIDDVPTRAVSMSIRQIMKSAKIIVTAPDTRKAQAVKNAIEGPVTNQYPSSILQQHPNCSFHLDLGSARQLTQHGKTADPE